MHDICRRFTQALYVGATFLFIFASALSAQGQVSGGVLGGAGSGGGGVLVGTNLVTSLAAGDRMSISVVGTNATLIADEAATKVGDGVVQPDFEMFGSTPGPGATVEERGDLFWWHFEVLQSTSISAIMLFNGYASPEVTDWGLYTDDRTTELAAGISFYPGYHNDGGRRTYAYFASPVALEAGTRYAIRLQMTDHGSGDIRGLAFGPGMNPVSTYYELVYYAEHEGGVGDPATPFSYSDTPPDSTSLFIGLAYAGGDGYDPATKVKVDQSMNVSVADNTATFSVNFPRSVVQAGDGVSAVATNDFLNESGYVDIHTDATPDEFICVQSVAGASIVGIGVERWGSTSVDLNDSYTVEVWNEPMTELIGTTTLQLSDDAAERYTALFSPPVATTGGLDYIIKLIKNPGFYTRMKSGPATTIPDLTESDFHLMGFRRDRFDDPGVRPLAEDWCYYRGGTGVNNMTGIDIYTGDAGYSEFEFLKAGEGVAAQSIGDSTVELSLATVWDDMRVVPGAFDFAGVADPALEPWQPGAAGATFQVFEFAVDDEAFVSVQVPHGYVAGTDLKPHIHWTPGPNGNEESGAAVGWKIDYSIAGVGEAFPVSGTVDLSDTVTGTDDLHEVTQSGTISGTGIAESDIIMMRVYRSDTGADDTWAGIVSGSLPLFLEIDIHYQLNKLGSAEEIP